MKKKRIRYSDLATSDTPANPAAASAAHPSLVTGAHPPLGRPVSPPTIAATMRVPVVAKVETSPVAPPEVVPPRPLREQVRLREGQLEVLLFRVAEERFAIELAMVEEAIDIPPVHHVPEMPSAMLGVITVRGMLTSVYSPAAALGLALHDGTSALIFRRGRARIAIVVDEVDDVATLDLATLRDAPTLETGESVLLGVVRQRDALLALVDAEALIAACQAAPLLETA